METVDELWFKEQRVAIEQARNRAEEALGLFRKATEALPLLDAALRKGRGEAKRLLTDIENAGRQATDAVTRSGAEQAQKLAALAEESNRLRSGLTGASAHEVAILRQEATTLLGSLSARHTEFLEEARKVLASALPELADRIAEVVARLRVVEEAITKDRQVLNQMNRFLLDQGQQIVELKQRLSAVEGVVESDRQRRADIERLRQDNATIRGTIAALQGQIVRLTGALSWFFAAPWWRRLFSRPSE